jgi:hypothetical protein
VEDIMTAHEPRPQIERERDQGELVDLVYGVFERTFAADGPERGLGLLREALQSLDAGALHSLVYRMGLDTEPVQEDTKETREGG